jgi:hypothetical protein
MTYGEKQNGEKKREDYLKKGKRGMIKRNESETANYMQKGSAE